ATLYLRDYLPENIIDRQVAEFSFNDFQPDPQDLRHIMWVTSYDNDFISPYAMSEFRNAGVDTQLGRFFPEVPYAGLWHIPYQTRLVDSKTEPAVNAPGYRKKDDLVRDPCLTDPDYRDKLRAELTAQLNATAPFSTTELSMGDEDSFVTEKFDLCMSPTCNEDFRTFLKKEYNNSLYQVNREWGTNYRNWADVVPITLEEAKRNGHYPQWVDHRRHMEAVWAGIFAYGREVSQQVVPTARVGYEGSDRWIGSYTAADYWKLSQSMNMNCTYNSDFHNAVTRDFAVPGSLIGLGWFGGYAESRNTPYMRYQPWRTLLNGANSMWIWNGNGGVGSVIGYDLGMEDFYKASCAEINEMKAGPAKMLISSKRQHDGIAILWSPSSVHVATYTKGLDSQAAYDSLVRIISDLGLTSKIISYEVLADGGLRNDEFKTLILPQCQALSRAEITAIKNFVQAGGNVIADIRPGMTDEHGKPYPIGMLDEVFGVKHDDIENFNLGQGELKPTEDGFYLGTTRVDKNLRVTTGRAKGKVDAIPVMVTNKYGNGTADLFNLPLPEYAAKADAQLKDGDFVGYAGGKRLRKLFGNLLANDGVVPVVSITPEQPDVEINRYANGDIQYVGIMQKLARDPLAYSYGEAANPAGIPVKINFPPNKYLYDVRNGIYLGQTDSINTTLLPGVAQLYAVLPYRVTGLRLNAQQTVVA
ncbi:MAG: alpha-amylase family protein, partial [bacterium]